jgi:transcriptional regulator with GAF, ATPase, and Fis domain
MVDALLITDVGDGAETEVRLGEETSIGRAASNTIVIDDAAVSRRHALIRAQATGEFILIDLGSSNGTLLNGHCLTLPCPLKSGDVVCIGPATLTFRCGVDEPAVAGQTTTEELTSGGDPARGPAFVGASAAMVDVFRLIHQAAASPIPVLIEGETGTGKELVARAIHGASGRAAAPFVAVNCAALPETLLESQLFGHRRGAFTGATHDQRGLFETANGGTVFLDEVGEMPAPMQAKLLRVLQEGEVVPLGEHNPRRVDVRVVSATNRDLAAEVDAGRIRADLYYRLSAFPIQLPPLRERRDDIPLLAERFLAAAAARHGKPDVGFEPAAVELLVRSEWPGNVRELQNAVERAVAMVRAGERIGVAHLAARFQGSGAQAVEATAPASDENPTALRPARAAFERQHIAEVLRQHGGNVTRAAAALGLSRAMLQLKMKEYGLRDRDPG